MEAREEKAVSEPSTTPVLVVRPDEGESYWQPVPANGYAEVRVSHRRDPAIVGLASGIQMIAAGCHIREHVHPDQDELLFFFAGRGEVVVDGVGHALVTGTTVYIGAGHRHRIVNGDSAAELGMMWVMLPGGENGLDDFFARIGRPRRPGEPVPEPFPRPDDVEAIEAATVFRHG
jgi:mannose-6-phosphate isomerase-like protein (cupin superfamily)